MRPPSKKEAAGFDLVVWVDNDGDVVCRAFTPAGDKALRAFVNQYSKGDIVVIHCHPDDFENELPTGIRVGLLKTGNKKVVPMKQSDLH